MNNSFFDFNLLAFPTRKDLQCTIEGKGRLNVLVLARFSKESRDVDYTFLENILQAANLTPMEEEIFLLETENKNLQLSLADLSKQLGVKHILIFGLDVASLGIRAELPLYQFSLLNGRKLLLAHDIKIIRTERAAKNSQKAAALWRALKEQFLP